MRFKRMIGLVVAAGVAGCSNGSENIKVGGAWATLPVTCSAYERGSADYAACLERDREASVPYAAPASPSIAAQTGATQTGVRSAR